MATLAFTYNHLRDPMNPGDLAYRIAQQFNLTTLPVVDINPTQIIVTHPQAGEAQRAAVQALINAYTLDPDWPGGDDNASVLIYRARQALAVNDTFLALGSPTNAQTLAQVQRLTRECSALIRLAIGVADSIAGT